VGTVLSLPSSGQASIANQAWRAGTLSMRAVFNDPTSSDPAKKYAVSNEFDRLVNNAAAGSTIRLSMYDITLEKEARLLVDAAKDPKRHIHVKVVTDGTSVIFPAINGKPSKANPAYTLLKKGLGTDIRKASWLVTCPYEIHGTSGHQTLTTHACIGDRRKRAINHTKFATFSRTGGISDVTYVTSGNLTLGSGPYAWNNAVTLNGDVTTYHAYIGFHTDLAHKRKVARNDYFSFRKPKAGSLGRGYFFPEAGKDPAGGIDSRTDVVANFLNKISCTGNHRIGTPGNHHTIVRAAVAWWSRPNIARKLWSLDNAGCDVEVAMTRDAYDAKVLAIMTNPSGARHGGVKVHIFPDLKHDYVHSKYLLVEGKYNNKPDAGVVWTGSHNFTITALRTFDETTLQLFGGGRLAPAYAANFKRVAAAAPCTRQMGRTSCVNRSAARMAPTPQDDAAAILLEQG
jgi:PLD-like domain